MDNTDILGILKLVWPLIVIQLGLQLYAIFDLLKRGKTRNLNLGVWLVIILLGEIVGALIYLIVGRSEE